MKATIFVTVFIIAAVLAQECKPRNHFWRPYNGNIPDDAFIAGFDNDGRKNYVAKIIVPDDGLWTIPVQLKEGFSQVNIAWCCTNENLGQKIMKVDKAIEILCVDNPRSLRWVGAEKHGDVLENCCLVEAGLGKLNGRNQARYIGKGLVNGINYVGRLRLGKELQELHVMDGNNSTMIRKNFEILTYGCKEGHGSPSETDKNQLTIE
ncbi:hypothetical protein HHI36_001371 [Cryptolaemus montrouzieri]|uniref:Uncharacterized protein n=1 Tax=Cryptolaemus montrouzieri TaxID=559131 RepID=A0ABD2P827_9CUCU